MSSLTAYYPLTIFQSLIGNARAIRFVSRTLNNHWKIALLIWFSFKHTIYGFKVLYLLDFY